MSTSLTDFDTTRRRMQWLFIHYELRQNGGLELEEGRSCDSKRCHSAG